jgi:hypothetical protein
VRARDVGLAVWRNVAARERRSVIVAERRVWKDGEGEEEGLSVYWHPGQWRKRWSRESGA